MRGGEAKGVERKRARKFNTKSRQTNTRVSISLRSETHSTLSPRDRLLFSVYFSNHVRGYYFSIYETPQIYPQPPNLHQL